MEIIPLLLYIESTRGFQVVPYLDRCYGRNWSGFVKIACSDQDFEIIENKEEGLQQAV
jgi:hypothetical protein